MFSGVLYSARGKKQEIHPQYHSRSVVPETKHDDGQPSPLCAHLMHAMQRLGEEGNRPTEGAAQYGLASGSSHLVRDMDAGPPYPVLSCICRGPAMGRRPLSGALLNTGSLVCS
jgi:hypothetical protein